MSPFVRLQTSNRQTLILTVRSGLFLASLPNLRPLGTLIINQQELGNELAVVLSVPVLLLFFFSPFYGQYYFHLNLAVVVCEATRRNLSAFWIGVGLQNEGDRRNSGCHYRFTIWPYRIWSIFYGDLQVEFPPKNGLDKKRGRLIDGRVLLRSLQPSFYWMNGGKRVGVKFPISLAFERCNKILNRILSFKASFAPGSNFRKLPRHKQEYWHLPTII